LKSLDNAGTGTPQAGLMFRASAASATDPFAAIVQTTASQLIFEYRTTAGGTITLTSVSGISISGEFLNLIRQGSNYSAYYGTDGIHWTQLGSTIAIVAIPAIANAGLAVTSNYNPQLSSATFAGVEIVPDVFSDTTGNHTYAININPAIAGELQIFIDVPETSTPMYQIALSQVPYLTFNFGSGTDAVTVDESSGNPIPSGGATLATSNGTDSLTFIGATTATTANITVNDNSQFNFTAGTGSTINYIPISAINISASATAVVNASSIHSNRSVLITSGLNFGGSFGAWQGQLNLNGNDMLVRGGNITNLTNQVTQGNGGIFSTVTATDSTHLTALGVIQNSTDGTTTGTALYGNTSLGLFDGITTISSDVLVKYTYIGDANLDGKVDASDYSRIDAAFGSAATGWYNGDFNLDGVINGSDYTLIDNAFNTQGARISALPAARQATPSAMFSALPIQPDPDKHKSKIQSVWCRLVSVSIAD
jgi:hypothetical protein